MDSTRARTITALLARVGCVLQHGSSQALARFSPFARWAVVIAAVVLHAPTPVAVTSHATAVVRGAAALTSFGAMTIVGL